MADTEAAQVQADQGWAAEVRRLAAQRDAVILAHNYQAREIQDVADHVGDSLGLSGLAAASNAIVIVFARNRKPAARWPTASPHPRSASGRPSIPEPWWWPT